MRQHSDVMQELQSPTQNSLLPRRPIPRLYHDCPGRLRRTALFPSVCLVFNWKTKETNPL
jgi:hypothetical protein